MSFLCTADGRKHNFRIAIFQHIRIASFLIYWCYGPQCMRLALVPLVWVLVHVSHSVLSVNGNPEFEFPPFVSLPLPPSSMAPPLPGDNDNVIDPQTLTVPQIRSILTARDVPLPSTNKKKEVYVDLWLRNLPSMNTLRQLCVEYDIDTSAMESREQIVALLLASMRARPRKAGRRRTLAPTPSPPRIRTVRSTGAVRRMHSSRSPSPPPPLSSPVSISRLNFADPTPPATLPSLAPPSSTAKLRRRRVLTSPSPPRFAAEQVTPFSSPSVALSPAFVSTNVARRIHFTPQQSMGWKSGVAGLVITVLIATTAATVPWVWYTTEFCGDGVNDEESCLPCPPHGICRDGYLVECEDGYCLSWLRNTCEKDENVARTAEFMVRSAQNLLARRNGMKACGEDVETCLTADILLENLNTMSVGIQSLPDSYKRTYLNSHLHNDVGCFSVDEVHKSSGCRAREWIKGHWTFVAVCICAVSTFSLILVRRRRRMARKTRVLSLVDEVCDVLFDQERRWRVHEVEMKSVRALDIRTHLMGLNYDATLWDEVAMETQKDNRVRMCVALYNGEQETMWEWDSPLSPKKQCRGRESMG